MESVDLELKVSRFTLALQCKIGKNCVKDLRMMIKTCIHAAEQRRRT